MGIFKKRPLNYGSKKKEMPEGLWQKCPQCGDLIHNLELTQNQRVCPKCEHHFTQGAFERIEHLTDPGTFVEHDAGMVSVDPLQFKGLVTYADTLKKYRNRTGLNEAVITGAASLLGHRVSLAVMDFSFLAATMGSVVGEKITRAIERGTKEGLPVIIIAASGGARMYEGMLSLMQMAKTCGALALARPGAPSLHFSAHKSDDSRGNGEFRLGGRSHHRGTELHDRLCRVLG